MSQTLELSLCRSLSKIEGGWVVLIPAGEFIGDDGRVWKNTNPQAIVQASDIKNIPWDIEHATHKLGSKGEPAPAYGWIEELKVDQDGAILGRVDFNSEGQDIVNQRKYRFYSPAFFHDHQGVVNRIASVGFTNVPNLPELPALNRKEDDMSTVHLSAVILTSLGLAEDATEDDAISAINTLKSDKQLALNRAESPDLTKFVPTETHQLALNRAETAETKLSEIRESEFETLVDGAISNGKVAPANKEMFLSMCRQDGGVDSFKTYLETAPQIASSETKHNKQPGNDATKLDEGELAMCRQMGLTEDEYLAAK
ncbi:phage protease [Vibrio europaeus]|uniref:phage protease n=1 Tax=Vibrio europaeus TaxID=300876 RepID=UPI00233ED113|nr:phage protease [Vibrio europaeus]MDC5753853.1 phage protease [Vibrio europaeus]MDC5776765.1 phage protease [Vibrio europaeus]MDC5796781.1 phage protease [Vibrio europaeus]MDC5801778.1 phage protease [Vibrio europaeus]MDC5815751.1 phage protease [Vibrio europaeus]